MLQTVGLLAVLAVAHFLPVKENSFANIFYCGRRGAVRNSRAEMFGASKRFRSLWHFGHDF